MNTFDDKLFDAIKDLDEVKQSVEEVKQSVEESIEQILNESKKNVSPSVYHLYHSAGGEGEKFVNWGYIKLKSDRNLDDAAKISITNFVLNYDGTHSIGCHADAFIIHLTDPNAYEGVDNLTVNGITYLKSAELTVEIILFHEKDEEDGKWYSLYTHTEGTGQVYHASTLLEVTCGNNIKLYSSMDINDERPNKAGYVNGQVTNGHTGTEVAASDYKYTLTDMPTEFSAQLAALDTRIKALETPTA